MSRVDEGRLPRTDAARAETAGLFAVLRAPDSAEASRAAAREALVHLHLPLVRRRVCRYALSRDLTEELVQVGAIGLLLAVDRFDPALGLEFSTYAVPTIDGEVKRHFRDHRWAVRLPRRLQELGVEVDRAATALTQTLGRSPTAAELAVRLDRPVEDVVEALESADVYVTVSLDVLPGGDPATRPGERWGAADAGLERVELRESLRPLLAGLEPRDRRLLQLRFVDNLTQSQIAAELGVSQMQVSRLLTRVLERLRAGLLDPDTR